MFHYLETQNGHGIVALPTGTGKGLVIAEFLRRLFTRWPEMRVLIPTHVKELVQQNFDELIGLWPTAPAGIYSAGLKRKDKHYPITFCGIQSVHKALKYFQPVHLVLVDECHLISDKDSTTYQRAFTELRAAVPRMRVIGLTATPYRLGMGLLTDGELFDDVIIDYTSYDRFNYLVDEGYICPLVPKKTETELAIHNVAIHGGEYVQSELQAVVDIDSSNRSAIAEAVNLGRGRRHWLVFCTGTQHADHVRDILIEHGIPSVSVHSDLPGPDEGRANLARWGIQAVGDTTRDMNINAFRAGQVGAMVGVGVFTTGFNFKDIDFIIVLRPTMSPILWVQLLGRGTRVIYAPGFDITTAEGRRSAIAASHKPNCLVLDFAANTRRLGPINDPVIPKKKGKKGSGMVPYKVCPHCQTYNHTRARFCVCCQAEFPQRVAITAEASQDELIRREKAQEKVADQVIFETFTVSRVDYNKHASRDRFKPPSLKITYYCNGGLNIFTEWLCLEHDGFARKKARDAWRNLESAGRFDNQLSDPPETVDEALQRLDHLKTPVGIRVLLRPKFPEVVGYTFGDEGVPIEQSEDIPTERMAF